MQEWRKRWDGGPPAARVVAATAMVVLIVGGVAAGAVYYWNPEVDRGTWSDDQTPVWRIELCGQDCYPHTTNDDAIIQADAQFVELDADYTIDDLTITDIGELDGGFESNNGQDRTLSCESIEIVGYNEVFVRDDVTVIARRAGD